MDQFKACLLSSAGVAELSEGEFVRVSVEPVTLQTHDKKATPYRGGLLTVTTLRLIWTNAARTSAIAAALQQVAADTPCTDISSPIHKRALLRLGGSGVRLLFDGQNKPGRDRDAVIQAIASAVAARDWDRLARERQKREDEKRREGEYVAGRGLGADAVRNRVVHARKEQSAALDTGLSSLDGLRRQAADLKRIAEMLKHMTASRAAGAGAGAGAGTSAGRVGVEGENELLQLLTEMGMEAPITKSATGGNVRVYREQLARQIGPFLRRSLQAVGGVMAMADAYCLVNRNRATTELVSPADFRAAVEQFAGLALGVRLVRLESGVLAVETDADNDPAGAAALRALAVRLTSVTAIDVMRARNIPIQRARGMLEQAEQLGMLARDETTEGIRFFPNTFFAGAVASQ